MDRIIRKLTYPYGFFIALTALSNPTQAMLTDFHRENQDTSRGSMYVHVKPDQIKEYFQEADTSPDIMGTLKRLQVEKTWEPSHYQFKNVELGKHFSSYQLSQDLSPEQIILANVCYDRYLKDKDDKSLMEAAHSNHALALHELSSFIKSDDLDLSRNLLYRSAAQGNALSLYELSTELEGNQPEFAKALCQEAADLGYDEAQYALASAPLTGAYGVPRNVETAMSQIEQLAGTQNHVAIKAFESLKSLTPEELFEMIDYMTI